MTIRVGFLGGGFIAHYHGKMLHTSGSDARIVAVHDPDEAKAARFAERSGATVVADPDAVLAASDAVYVCTWTAEHRRLVEQVAAAGLPVFCEKPLATTLDDATAMVEAVRRAGVVNQVGLVLRDSPSFNLLKALIDDPASGRVMSVVFRDDQYLPVQGIYESDWRGDPARAGSGTLLEHSIHDLDLLAWLCGPVASVGGRSAEFHELAGIEDVAVAVLAFASGAVASLTSVWHDVLARPSMRHVEVFCERAYLVLEGDALGPVRWSRADGSSGVLEGDALLAALAERGTALRNPDAGFVEAVEAGTAATPDFADALGAHVLADAFYRSARSGGAPVAVAPAGPPP